MRLVFVELLYILLIVNNMNKVGKKVCQIFLRFKMVCNSNLESIHLSVNWIKGCYERNYLDYENQNL